MSTQSITMNRPRKKGAKYLSFWSLLSLCLFVVFAAGLIGNAGQTLSPLYTLGAVGICFVTAWGVRAHFHKKEAHWVHELQISGALLLGAHMLGASWSHLSPLVFLALGMVGILVDRKTLLSAIGLSIVFSLVAFFHAATQVPMMDMAVHFLFTILFGFSAFIISRTFEFKKKLFRNDDEIASENSRREVQELHLHTLTEATASRERTRELISRNAVNAVNQSVFLSLSLLKTGLNCHSVVLLWFDVSQKNLRIKEMVSDSDNIIEGEISPAKGVIGGITRRRESLQLNQLRDGFRGIPYYRSASGKIKSFIGIPVLEDGHLRGVICADRTSDQDFDDADLDVLQEAADYIVRTIENERLFTQIEKSKYELGRFFDASRKLNTVLTTDQALQTTIECIKDIVPFDFAAITTIREDGQHEIRTAFGPLEDTVGKRFSDNNGLVSMVCRNRHYLPYGGKVRDGKTLIFSDDIDVPSAKSILVLPLIAQDICAGTLIVGTAAPNAYTSERREMLEVVANQAAVTFANAQLYEQMRELATTDGLTGLANHRTFQSKTDEAIARHKRTGKSFCLLLTDIDHFKNVNDTHGHPAGDEVLRQFADAFRALLRETDTPCRYGGEEFTIILEETDTEGAMLIANRIREKVKSLSFESEAGKFNCSLSIGVATWPKDATEKQELIDLADKALYYSKENGRDRVTPVSQLSE